MRKKGMPPRKRAVLGSNSEEESKSPRTNSSWKQRARNEASKRKKGVIEGNGEKKVKHWNEEVDAEHENGEFDEDIPAAQNETEVDDQKYKLTDHGGPLDYSLLKDFKDHVALAVWSGEERGVLTFRHHYGRYVNDWILSSEPPDVVELVNGSGLTNLVSYPWRYLDKAMISAFIERWYPETNTFHLPFGEMTITLDDISRILGIPVGGTPLVFNKVETSMKSNHYTALLCELLGIPVEESLKEFEKNKSFQVDLKWIKKQCSQSEKNPNGCDKRMIARAYLFYLLGSTLFNDKSGTRTSVYYLEALKDIEGSSNMCWGSAALSYVYRQLGCASRASVKQIAGFLPLLEVWILDHFSLRGVPNLGYTAGEPTINKWQSQQHAGEDSNAALIVIREELDMLVAEQVIWFPNSVDHPLQMVTWYSGCLICFDIIEAYHPERVVRQMGRVQSIPNAPILPTLSNRSKHGKSYKVEHAILQHYTDNWENHIVPVEQQGPPVNYHSQASTDYIDWFYNISHPYVANPYKRVTGPLLNATHHFNDMRKGISKALLMLQSAAANKNYEEAHKEIEAILSQTQERRTDGTNNWRRGGF